MAHPIKSLTIEGYKSIRKLENFELKGLNVLIGANGAGKSNFIGFFKLLRSMVEQQLKLAIKRDEGGADGCLFLGPKITPRLSSQVSFGRNRYQFSLEPTPQNEFVFSKEEVAFFGDLGTDRTSFGAGHSESKLRDRKDDRGRWGAAKVVEAHVYDSISNWTVYHFHDTSPLAPVRRPQERNDDQYLRPQAENLAAVLYRLQQSHAQQYKEIVEAVRLAAPFFDDFVLRPIPPSESMIELEWRQRSSDFPFRANHLSDGTLRFICLATALLQPKRPVTIVVDEPELGLHPSAISILGELFRNAAAKRFGLVTHQVIISTQSVPLLNEFLPEDVIVVERHDQESIFHRLQPEDLTEWLQEYSLGDLWQKNVLGGHPSQYALHYVPDSLGGREP